jgi:hypothetical protein
MASRPDIVRGRGPEGRLKIELERESGGWGTTNASDRLFTQRDPLVVDGEVGVLPGVKRLLAAQPAEAAPHSMDERLYAGGSYAYVGNSPVVRIDPTGLRWFFWGRVTNHSSKKIIVAGNLNNDGPQFFAYLPPGAESREYFRRRKPALYDIDGVWVGPDETYADYTEWIERSGGARHYTDGKFKIGDTDNADVYDVGEDQGVATCPFAHVFLIYDYERYFEAGVYPDGDRTWTLPPPSGIVDYGP